MSGVTILNQVDIFACHNWMRFYPLFIVVGAIMCLISLRCCAGSCDIVEEIISGIFFVVSIALVIFGAITCYLADKNETYDHTEYDVIVSDDVHFEDFMSRYDIISQRGMIYTVKERKESN